MVLPCCAPISAPELRSVWGRLLPAGRGQGQGQGQARPDRSRSRALEHAAWCTRAQGHGGTPFTVVAVLPSKATPPPWPCSCTYPDRSDLTAVPMHHHETHEPAGSRCGRKAIRHAWIWMHGSSQVQVLAIFRTACVHSDCQVGLFTTAGTFNVPSFVWWHEQTQTRPRPHACWS